MSKAEQKRLASTAHHEAGHAVACIFAEGQPIGFRRVSITPDDAEGTLGHVLQKRVPKAVVRDAESGYLSPRTTRYLENMAVVLLAGQAASERYHGRRGNFGSAVYDNDPQFGKVIVDGDQRKAVFVLEPIAGGDSEEIGLLWKLAAHRASRLVQVHWPLIEKLAAALLERRELTEAEVREVLF